MLKIISLSSNTTRIVLLAVSTMVIGLGFQNCAKQNQEDSSSLSKESIDTDPSRYAAPEIEILNTVPTVLKIDSVIVNFKVNFFGLGQLTNATCTLNGVLLRNCTDGMVTIENLKDSSNQLVISAMGTYDRKPQDKVIVFQVDKTPPNVRFSSVPADPSNQKNFNFTFLATDSMTDVASVECSLDGGLYISCTSMSQFNVTNLSNGEHTLSVRATDRNNNRSTPIQYRWQVDFDAPTLKLTKSPDIITKNKNAEFNFTVTDNSTGSLQTRCRLEPAEYTSCSNSFSQSNLTEGPKVFWLEAKDSAANVTTLKFEWTVDSMGPAKPRIAASTPAFTQAKDITYVFSAEEATSGISYMCAFNSTSYSTCTSPLEKRSLADGLYELKAQAFDSLNNPSEIQTLQVLVDTVKPDTLLAMVSNIAASVDINVNVNKGSGSNISSSKCQLNSGDWFDCGGLLKLTTLTEAAYVLNLVAKDLAGNESRASLNFIFDKTAPTILLSKTPTASTQLSDFIFEFSVAESLSGVDKVECAVDSYVFSPCTSVTTHRVQGLSQGAHVFRIKAIDKNANQSEMTNFNWSIDNNAPVFQINANVTAITSQPAATFTVQTTETDLKYKCKFSAPEFAACSFPNVVNSLQTGAYSFYVEAEDSAGNKTSQRFSWRVDRNAPTKPVITSPKAAITKDRNLEFNFMSVENEGAVIYKCSLNSTAMSTCSSPFRFTVTADDNYVFKVEATDEAGNVSDVAAASSLIDTAPPVVSALLSRMDESGLAFSISADKGSGSGSDLRSVECKLNSTNWTSCSAEVSYDQISGRDYVFHVRATDLAENVGEISIPIEYGRNLVAVGRSHTCAIRFGKLYCWGENKNGQLGDGTKISKFKPTLVLEAGVTAVSAGDAHTCAIVSGALKCWGYGIVNRTVSTSPVTVVASGVTHVAAGFNHTCYATPTDVFCFGENQWGQLGNGRTDTQFVASPQRSMAGPVDSLNSGAGFSCAAAQTQAKCWGLNDQGQLGQGTTANSTSPVAVAGLTDVKSVQTGLQHACAISQSGTLRCWGANYDGQIGNEVPSNTPVQSPYLVQLSNVQSVALGFTHTCAVSENKVFCWGNNSLGQFGSGSTTNLLRPTQIGTLTWSGVAARWNTTCGVSDGLKVSCWGQNNSGQIGNNQAGISFLPTKVADVAADSISASDSHSCVTVGGALQCWGANFGGQLGTGTLDSSQVPLSAHSAFAGAQKVIVGASNSCMISNGALKCWGLNQSGQLGTSTAVLQIYTAIPSGVVAASVGAGHICAVRNTNGGELWCMGNNSSGQLGLGDTNRRTNMIRVISTGVTDVSASANHTCAVVSGALKCFGANNNLQLGVNDANPRLLPTTVVGLEINVLRVSTSKFGTCAIIADNSYSGGKFAACWGSYKGNTTLQTTKTIEFEGDLKTLAMGDSHVCAHIDQSVQCLGDGSNGQLGYGAVLRSDLAQTINITGVSGLESGANHNCASTATGVFCWGLNQAGEVGNGKAWVATPFQINYN